MSKYVLRIHLLNKHKYNNIQARKGANITGKYNSQNSKLQKIGDFSEELKESLKMSSQNVGVENPDKNERIGPFPCKLCSTDFATKAIFDDHILSVHLETPKLKCHLCHKSFQLERKLKSHIKIVHEFLNEDGREESESNSMNNSDSAKGQLISE